jgi:hypothetical protein
MFARFESHYRPDESIPKDPKPSAIEIERIETVANGFTECMTRFGGESFNDGVFRFHLISDIGRWTGIVREAFPSYQSRLICFAYDWLGRHFAIDLLRKEGNQCLILLAEPGTGETLEIPATLENFLDIELVDHADSATACNFYQEWRVSGGARPTAGQCVGYKVPLFLGGVDDLPNLEVTDMDVYWSIHGQILNRIRGNSTIE